MNDSFAYLPLLIAATSAFITVIILAANKEGYCRSILTIHILGAIIVCAGSIYTILNPMILPIATTIAVATTLMLAASLIHRVLSEKHAKTDDSTVPSVRSPEGQQGQSFDSTRRLMEEGKKIVESACSSAHHPTSLRQLVEQANAVLIQETDADGGMVLLIDGFDGVLTVSALSGNVPPPYPLPDAIPHQAAAVADYLRSTTLSLKHSIFGEVAQAGTGELIANPSTDSRITLNGPEAFLQASSYIILPAKVQQDTVAVIVLARDVQAAPFSEREYEISSLLLDYINIALNIAYSYKEFADRIELTQETNLIQTAQSKLYSKQLPKLPAISLGLLHKKAERACGDFYDIIPARKDRIFFVVGDIAGKGMDSFMTMVMLKAMFHLTANTTQNAGDVLSWINRSIAAERNFEHFASVALINFNSSERKVQVAVGGFMPVLVFHHDSKTVERISDNVPPVGAEKMATYKTREFQLKENDIIVTFSDGIIETQNATGEQYSLQRLIDTIARNRRLSGREIGEAVKSDLLNFSGDNRYFDDQTFLVLKIQ